MGWQLSITMTPEGFGSSPKEVVAAASSIEVIDASTGKLPSLPVSDAIPLGELDLSSHGRWFYAADDDEDDFELPAQSFAVNSRA